jgi:hypothetical protein
MGNPAPETLGLFFPFFFNSVRLFIRPETPLRRPWLGFSSGRGIRPRSGDPGFVFSPLFSIRFVFSSAGSSAPETLAWFFHPGANPPRIWRSWVLTKMQPGLCGTRSLPDLLCACGLRVRHSGCSGALETPPLLSVNLSSGSICFNLAPSVSGAERTRPGAGKSAALS